MDLFVVDGNDDLAEALYYYQKESNVTKNAPIGFLNDIEFEVVMKDNKFNPSMYKAILYRKVYDALKSGAIVLLESYRYMSIEEYLIDKQEWEKNKASILDCTNLKKFHDIDCYNGGATRS